VPPPALQAAGPAAAAAAEADDEAESESDDLEDSEENFVLDGADLRSIFGSGRTRSQLSENLAPSGEEHSGRELLDDARSLVDELLRRRSA
jgi:hypothetical protein